ncbi:TPA: chromosome segregation protein SMC [Candidatus Micrarchaeota archaeon]|nr:chromosome segregation protein SMC [Candidatus Micrarchaeota archaeon]
MFISKIMMQNFKSFKKGEVVLRPGFNAIVGPNGSGKSNLVDMVLFAFGESRFKSMRVKKIRDLIFEDAGVAEVSLVLSDGIKERTIKRALRKDGKIKYFVDGKRVKKYALEEFLSHNNLSSNHVIKQGEVQRIVEMNPKDRRGLIDFIAGVSEYEEKKREALSELDKVHSKVSEEKAVIAEKQGYLAELEKDKANAQKFVEFDSRLKKTKATILHLELSDLQDEFASLVNASLDLDNKIRALSGEIRSFEEQIAEKQRKKDEINKQIIEKSAGKEGEIQRQIDFLQKEMDDSKLLIGKNQGLLKEKGASLLEASTEKRKAEDSLSSAKKQALELDEECAAIQKILLEKQAEYDALMSKTTAFSEQFRTARAKMSSLEQELLQVKDSLNQLQSDVSIAEEKRRLKQDELERLQTGRFEDYSPQKGMLEEHLQQLTLEVQRVDALLKALVDEERQAFEKMGLIDEDVLRAREKISIADARLKTAGSSRSIDVVEKLRSEIKGVYGTLQQLIDYDPAFSLPVSVSMGQRLHYAVVDSVRTAGKAIELLKKNNWGRLSFIPLDKIHDYDISPEEFKLKKSEGAIDFLVKLLRYDAKYAKAVHFVCSNTLVMEDFVTAEELVGRVRMVTLDGELVEQSGLVSGGRAREEINPFVEAKELQKWEEKMETLLSTKDGISKKLSFTRGELGELRRKKAEAEVAKTKTELELRHILDEDRALGEKQKNVSKAAAQLKQEMKELQSVVDKKSGERNELVRRISGLNSQYLTAKELVDTEKEEQFGNLVREKEKKISDLRVQAADYSSQASAKKTEVSSLEKQFSFLEKRERELESEERSLREEIQTADERISKHTVVMREKVEEQKKMSSAMRDLYEQREDAEKGIAKFADSKGRMQAELELQIQPRQQDVGYKRAGVEARLTELKAQYSAFEGVEILQGEKNELIVQSKELEAEIISLGPINMRAIDMFEEKTREFLQHRDRLTQLENERKAVLILIEEIEGRKKATFMQSFDRVNDNYQKLFKHIFDGEGSLLLENQEDPFEGGLTMQVRLENKEVKYLELMSGGEKSLLALIFIFGMQGVNKSSVYVLDEADAALDDENSRKLAELLKAMSKETQFVVVTHNETVYRQADTLVGVAMAGREGSKLVEVKLSQPIAAK